MPHKTHAGLGLALTAGLLTSIVAPTLAATPEPSEASGVSALTFHGGRQNQELGYSLNGQICDLDDDGFAEVTAGSAVGYGSSAYADMPAYRRSVAGLQDSATELPHWWNDSTDRTRPGWVCVQDTNGDSLDDLLQLPITSARVASLSLASQVRNEAGKLIDHRAVNYQFPAGATRLGASAAESAGDVDGDDLGDVVLSAHIAAPAEGTGNGSLWVLAGASSPTVPAAVRAVDLAGAPGPSQVVAVIRAAPGDDALTAEPVGDVNGDGLDDLAIAAADSGKVWLVYGQQRGAETRELELGDMAPADGRLWITQANGAGLGSSLAVADDVNGDGVQDLVLGTSTNTSASGGVAVVFGSVSPQTVVVDQAAGTVNTADGGQGFWVAAERAGDALGYSVAGLADLNGDGRTELLIGAPGYDPGAGTGVLTDAGAAYVIHGRATTSTVALGSLAHGDGYRLEGTRGVDQPAGRASMFGYRVARAGDVDGNGVEDFAVAAPGRSDHASYRNGGVHVALLGELSTTIDLRVSRRVGDGGVQVDAARNQLTTGDRLDLRANLRLSTLQGHTGEVVFELDGQPLGGCANVASIPSAPHRSYAYCEQGLRITEFGEHTLAASHAGTQDRYTPSRDATASLYVKDDSTTTLSSAVDGGTVTLTARVAPASSARPVQGGTVTFAAADAGGPLRGCESVAVAAGEATCQVPSQLGTRGFVARFTGLSVADAASPGTEIAVLAPSSGELTHEELVETHVTLSLSRTSIRHGDAAQVSVGVHPQTSAQVELLLDGRVVGTAPAVDHAASFALPRDLSVGTHTVVARVPQGDTTRAAVSPSATLSVDRARAGGISLNAKPFARGARPVMTVRVGPQSDGRQPTGQLRIKYGPKVQRVALGEAQHGKVKVRLANSVRKAIRVRVTFVPSDTDNVQAPKAAKRTLRPRR